MDQTEITTSFRQARNKSEQIRILADLSDTDTETVIEVLKDNDMCVSVAKCRRCGRTFQKYLRPYCPTCERLIAAQKRQAENYKRWVLWQIKQNAVKRKALVRMVKDLDIDTQRLKEEING